MKKKNTALMLAAMVCASSLLIGCGEKEDTASKNTETAEEKEPAEDGKDETDATETESKESLKEDGNVSDHEPISILSSHKNMSAFMELVHEKYPEINLEIIPYSGGNFSSYVKSQLVTGDMPDIYSTKVYTPGQMEISDKLVDLSGYDFTSQYSEARLRDVTEDGAVYLLPTYYDCIGITYNKTLLEKHGWTLPKSLKELEELVPKVEEAGCQLAVNQLQYAGYGFQYLCNILDTDFLNTLDGRIWQNEFLAGDASVEDTPEMVESMKILDRWRDLGLLNGNGNPNDDGETRKIMGEGNTLFMLGSSNNFKEGETTDEFGLMPYLSEDGSQNVYIILNVSRYIGLNKHLEDEGNEQKLEDALHVMEILSTEDGMRAFNSYYSNISLLPLKEFSVDEDNLYADILDELNAGFTAPFIYSGWENIVVDTGEKMLSYIKGECEIEDIIKVMDEEQPLLLDNASAVYATATEKIDNTNCARILGIATAQASKADLALVSVNKWYEMDDQDDLNLEGVSGELYPVPITDHVITSIMPTDCWHGTIRTVTLTGKRIKELVETGYDRNGNGKTFPYVLVTPEGMELEDAKEYTAVIYGVTDEVAEEGNLTDTGILSLEAMEEYFGQFDTFSAEDIVWEK